MCIAISGCQLFQKKELVKEMPRPNIVFILADDLGYGDLGINGQQKIKTPHIDKLASEGLVFTNHYSGSTVCAPSRASLMTGLHTGHVSVRGNKRVLPEGQFPVQEDFNLAKMLKKKGYKTGAFGKWGLGYPGSKSDPNTFGFDEFYGYVCQTLAHRYYPEYLWENDKKVILEGNGGDAVIYSNDLIQKKAIKFIEDSKDEPFFLYVPSLIPHLELIAPNDEIIAKYKGIFPETPYKAGKGGDYGPGWDATKYCSQESPRAMYAAMVSRLDRDVGEILAKLDELGIADNTLVFFTSDNGPDYKGGADPDFFNSTAGLRGYKRDLYQGGVRVPMIARWTGKIAAGTTDHVSAFWDITSTMAQLVNIDSIPNTDGISFLPTLLGEKSQREHDYLYWEFASDGLERQALLKEDWKIVKVRSDKGTTVELFNIERDPKETEDLSTKEPEMLKELFLKMEKAHVPNTDFPISMVDSDR
jgi:arylsulfatase A-like enzyme